MSSYKSYAITLKYALNPEGTFSYVKLLKRQSMVPNAILQTLNATLQEIVEPEPIIIPEDTPAKEIVETEPEPIIIPEDTPTQEIVETEPEPIIVPEDTPAKEIVETEPEPIIIPEDTPAKEIVESKPEPIIIPEDTPTQEIVETEPEPIIVPEDTPAKEIVESKPEPIIIPEDTPAKEIVESKPETIIIPTNAQQPVYVQYIDPAQIRYVQPVQYVPPVKTTVEIGQEAEDMIMDYLLKVSSMNQDFEVDDTSNIAKHGDIAVRYRQKRICIEIKNYKTRVPVKEIEKYRKSLALAEYDAGILIQINKHGFASKEDIKSPIDLRFDNKKPSAYLTACDVELIYPIINLLIENIKNAVDDSVMEKKRKALLDIHDKIKKLRKTIDTQKKAIAAMETTVEAIAKLSVV